MKIAELISALFYATKYLNFNTIYQVCQSKNIFQFFSSFLKITEFHFFSRLINSESNSNPSDVSIYSGVLIKIKSIRCFLSFI
jgi:hypothetical protein